VRTVVLGERPRVLEELIEERRRLGLDGHDEVWEGEHHLAPHAHTRHGLVEAQLAVVLGMRARAAGLWWSGAFDLGQPDDFRVPDAGAFAEPPGTLYARTAVIVVEVLSPDDETFAKLGFYAARGVEELVVADPQERSVRLWQLRDGALVDTGRSDLLDVEAATVVDEVRWP